MLQCAAVEGGCNLFQVGFVFVAVCCSVLQCVAVEGSRCQFLVGCVVSVCGHREDPVAVCCNVLQCVGREQGVRFSVL